MPEVAVVVIAVREERDSKEALESHMEMENNTSVLDQSARCNADARMKVVVAYIRRWTGVEMK